MFHEENSGEPSRSSLPLVQRKSSTCWDCFCCQPWFELPVFPCCHLCTWLCWVQVVPPVGVWPCPGLQQGVGCGCLQSQGSAVHRGRDGENSTLCSAWAHSFPEDRAALLGQRNVKILKAFKLFSFYLGAFCALLVALQSSQPSV